MNKTYAHLIVGQEEPELMPNEVAYRLSQLLGYPHFLIHQALVNVNPALIQTDEDWYLSEEALPAVSAEISRLLLLETLTPTPVKTLASCATSKTTTVQ